LQPAFEFGGFSPDVAHFGQGVALYHGGSFGECDRLIVPLREDAKARELRNRVFYENTSLQPADVVKTQFLWLK
jgi:hypothetical protein